MFAVYAEQANPHEPLQALRTGARPELVLVDGWVRVRVQASSLNHHDLWTLKGVGIKPEYFPMILGCDGAGLLDDGTEVVIHAVIPSPEFDGVDETMDPQRSLLTEKYPGTFAEYVTVPAANVVPKPVELSWAEAACLSTAWLTAYRMLRSRGQVQPGETVLVQGATGGVSSACIVLAKAMGARVWVTARSTVGADFAAQLGADAVFASGEHLPQRVDAVMESIGAATWAHSVRSLKPGGRIVISGATSGSQPPADLAHIYFRQLSVIGATMGTSVELQELLDLCVATGIRPLIDRELPLTSASAGFAALASGGVLGKIVFDHTR